MHQCFQSQMTPFAYESALQKSDFVSKSAILSGRTKQLHWLTKSFDFDRRIEETHLLCRRLCSVRLQQVHETSSIFCKCQPLSVSMHDRGANIIAETFVA